MAGTLTHAYFAMDVYEKLNMKSKELLVSEKESLKTFAQSMDVFMFYNITNLKKGKKIRRFANYSQEHHVFLYFNTLINYIKGSNYKFDSEVMAYLYGMIAHYVLDSTLHPYVIYRTGHYKKDKPETHKYNHFHNKMETYLDNYMVETREKIKHQKFKCYKFCFNIKGFNENLTDVLDHVYNEVFEIKNFHKYYLKSIKQMKFFYRAFRYDPFRLKKTFYQCVDLILPNTFLKTEPLSFNMNMEKKKWFLNLDKNTWYNPADKKIKHNTSVIEIYREAVEKAVNMINEINKFIYYDEDINLKKVVGNNSYSTGLDLTKKKEPKYFEF